MFDVEKKKKTKRLLIMRFSAMGDVAMTVPVVHALATQHPELRITMATRSRFVPLFEWMPANVQVMGIDFEDTDGIAGLFRLYKKLREKGFDAVADLHDVLRTKYLRTCFRLSGTKVAVIDKGRTAKKHLLGNGQHAEPLKPMTERYTDVFRSLGLPTTLPAHSSIVPSGTSLASNRAIVGRKQEGDKWVGVAPFAAHVQKIYPLDNMQNVVNALADRGCKVFLFGAGKMETDTLKAWERQGVVSICGKLGGLHNEMLLMSQLDLMLSMDSANMHIASIFDIPVLSIWGATHPKAGFAGYGQSADNIVQLDLPCRPCSIYGQRPCRYGDLHCMNITPATIISKAAALLNL